MVAAPSRLLRTATAVALAGSATTLAYVGSAAPAQAAGYNGYCKDASGVTVVVDFGAIGKGIAVRCAPVGAGATDLDAVQAAGIPIEGSRTYGLSVACRLYGEPAASRTLPGGYHESCMRMPPTNAYWSIWQASNGGSWSYAQSGVSGQSVTPGGFVGFSFVTGSNAAPRVAPKRPGGAAPAPRPSSTSKPAPKTTGATDPAATNPPAGGRDGSKTTAPQAGSSAKRSAAGSAGSTAGKPSAAPGSAGASAAASSPSAAGPSSASSSSAASAKASSSAALSSSSSAGASATGSGGAVAAGGPTIGDSDKLINDATKDNSSGLNATTLVGGGVLAALAVGGAAIAIARRRTSG
ncbi:hypothetical protein HJ588_05305 [Flexivirga sp. ID2601S]|uniref:Gram-positive cocci surface proteins LPxTG domain-containing protein n=1 Tax=Flexivirga aerilata TaxID=1656889 RepID=A0A849AHD4_9MICO|nr:hypothetical protein [Flexivirga aerilata]NNG38691.1 hypothetical protein [Flexivirga aerilata]